MMQIPMTPSVDDAQGSYDTATHGGHDAHSPSSDYAGAVEYDEVKHWMHEQAGLGEYYEAFIIALDSAAGMRVNPDPTEVLTADNEMLLIGSVESEQAFLDFFDR